MSFIDAPGTGILRSTSGVLSYINGTAAQFVKANGSLDSNTYLTGNQAITFTPTGDVTGSASGATSLTPALTIGANAVTYAKFAQSAAATLLGNPSGVLGNVSQITLGSGLSFSGSTLVATGSGGTVTGVTGTANRITSSGGTAPAIDISAVYVGQSSITTLGTIGTGIWQGTLVAPQFGGTGVNNGSNTLTIAGNLSTSGAFASVFTMTAATNVTFPTSGTLATTAGTASSVSNADGTLTISPTTGAVVASLALGHANVWTVAQTINVSTTTPLVIGNTASGGNLTLSSTSNATKGTIISDNLYVVGTALSGGSSTSNFFNITGTLPVTMTTTTYGTNYQITSAGSSSQIMAGINIDLLAGYTGGNAVIAGRYHNAVAGTGTNPFSAAGAANYGIFSNTNGTTAGANVGNYSFVANGNINYAYFGESATAKNSATNIGVAGFALNTGTSPIQIGGYFGLQASTPTFTSAALIADNGASSSPIFLARANGTIVFTVGSTGTSTLLADFKLGTVGNGLYVKEGTNATMGIATLVAGTATVSTTKVTANSRVHLTTQSLGGIAAPVGVAVTARTAGTSFTITSASALDTSTVAWVILEPA